MQLQVAAFKDTPWVSAQCHLSLRTGAMWVVQWWCSITVVLLHCSRLHRWPVKRVKIFENFQPLVSLIGSGGGTRSASSLLRLLKKDVVAAGHWFTLGASRERLQKHTWLAVELES